MRFRFAVTMLAFAVSVALAATNEPDLVHILVPGFTVRELPVRLSNLNNLRFAPDGRLFALGYDGRVHVLRDTNGDGLEDKDEIFWDQPTLSVPVGMALAPEGVYISSHGKISLLRDTNGNGKADTEEIIASGWPPTDVASGGVDATAVTLDQAGNVYFGLVTADYSNPYRLRKRKDLKPEEKAWLAAHNQPAEGDPEAEVSLYDINSVRGTIQKWSPKTKMFETFATGIRVPYTLAFNQHGDLFVTDQEGETWCPNGNPLDELNHIIPGHNYGFPPRHEKWLPNLVSDPPVVAFGPQHQSSCGFVFNEPKKGQGLFGPKWWVGDAFVAGESRGKIWRVRLVKTPYGYVGKEYLIARLPMLTTDVAISPKGDLYVSCHSGLPDWGTGPQGEGKILKISYTDPKAPQPVIAWAAGPNEVRVAFDQTLDASVTNAVVSQEIEFGEYVRAADRYEVLKPPYAVVKQQEATPRGRLKIVTAKLENDDQTLVLSTESHPQAVRYALTIPGVKAKGGKDRAVTVDVDYGFDGATVVATRDTLAKDLPPLLKGWGHSLGLELDEMEIAFSRSQPHPDTTIARPLLDGASPLIKAIDEDDKRQANKYLVKGLLNLPAGASGLNALAREPFDLGLRKDFGGKPNVSTVPAGKRPDGLFEAAIPLAAFPQFSRVQIRFTDKQATVALGYTLTGESAVHPFAPQHLLNMWAPEQRATASVTSSLPLAFDPGDYERGRELFFSDQLKCATCHRIRGQGGAIGPDLGNLVSRDAASVLRDIKEPSAAINPDFVAYQLTRRDASELTGFIRTQDADTLHLVAADGKETAVRVAEVKELRPSSLSLMPAGLLDKLKEGQVRDLLTFLLNAPPKRTRAEVKEILAAVPRESPSALKIVLVAGKQDHGPGQHDYPAWQQQWHAMLAPKAKVSDAWDWPSPEQFQSAGVVVFYFWNHDWNAERLGQLDGFLARGGGIVLLHSATIGNDQADLLAERTGLASYASPRTKYRHMPLELNLVVPAGSAITRGLPATLHLLDEPYWPLTGDSKKVEVLATAKVDDEARPLMWTFQKGKGRVFASILGHYTWTLDDPLFRILVLRGIAWAAGADSATLEHLAIKDADLK
jgi:putative heme-binding domain-containing protein